MRSKATAAPGARTRQSLLHPWCPGADLGSCQDPERNQSKATKLKEPEAQPSYGSREQRRDCVADEHFRSVLCFTQLHSRMQLWRGLDTIARSNAPRFVVRSYSIFLAVRTKHTISTQKMILILMLKSVVVYAFGSVGGMD